MNYTKEDLIANAHLMAAAPELYKLLDRAKGYVWNESQRMKKECACSLVQEDITNLYQDILKALLKADGKGE